MNLVKRNIKFVEIDSELGAGTRGASLGIGALKSAAYNKGYTYFSRYQSAEVPTLNKLLWKSDNTPFARRIGGIEEVYSRTIKQLVEEIQLGNFPIVLSGDHSTAGGTIAGIKKAYPHKRLGVVWIDAHADLHTPYTTPSGNVHGMPLATALQIDNLDQQRNTPNDETVHHWEALKKFGAENKLNPEDLVFVAVRDTEPQEEYVMAENRITNHLVEDVREAGTEEIVESILDQLTDCELIYVSFDVDSMDCDLVSHGTGTPVKNGLTPHEAQEIIIGLIASPKVCCFEMVEINPCLDEKTNFMAETAADILNETIASIEHD